MACRPPGFILADGIELTILVESEMFLQEHFSH